MVRTNSGSVLFANCLSPALNQRADFHFILQLGTFRSVICHSYTVLAELESACIASGPRLRSDASPPATKSASAIQLAAALVVMAHRVKSGVIVAATSGR